VFRGGYCSLGVLIECLEVAMEGLEVFKRSL